MRKSIIAAALLASVLSITACGPTENVNVAEENYDAAEGTTAAETTEETTEATTEETTAETTTEATTVVTTEVTTAKTTEVSAVTEVSGDAEKKDEKTEEFKAAEGFSSTYADLDNRAFGYNGKVLKLGESTFQDLVDAGVPFSEEDLLDADNNVNSGKTSGYYTFHVDDSKYSNLQLVFVNDTDTNIKLKECKLEMARWWAMIPRPTYDEERNAELKADLEAAAKHVSFAFPLTLTKSELIANSGEPTSEKLGTEYKNPGEVYGGYRFTFDTDSEVLQDVSIELLY